MTKFIIATFALIFACAIVLFILALIVNAIELFFRENKFEIFQNEIEKIAHGERFTCMIYEGRYSVTFQDLNLTVSGDSIKNVIKEIKNNILWEE